MQKVAPTLLLRPKFNKVLPVGQPAPAVPPKHLKKALQFERLQRKALSPLLEISVKPPECGLQIVFIGPINARCPVSVRAPADGLTDVPSSQVPEADTPRAEAKPKRALYHADDQHRVVALVENQGRGEMPAIGWRGGEAERSECREVGFHRLGQLEDTDGHDAAG